MLKKKSKKDKPDRGADHKDIVIDRKYGNCDIHFIKGKNVEIHIKRWKTSKTRGRCVGIDNCTIFIEHYHRKRKKKTVIPIDVGKVYKIYINEAGVKKFSVNSFKDLVGKEITIDRDIEQYRRIRGKVLDVTHRLLLVRAKKAKSQLPILSGMVFILDLSGIYAIRIFDDGNYNISDEKSSKMVERVEKRRTKGDEKSIEEFDKKHYGELEEWK